MLVEEGGLTRRQHTSKGRSYRALMVLTASERGAEPSRPVPKVVVPPSVPKRELVSPSLHSEAGS